MQSKSSCLQKLKEIKDVEDKNLLGLGSKRDYTKFSIIYNVENYYPSSRINTIISSTGSIDIKHYDFDESMSSWTSGNISADEMQELFEYIVNENHFFDLPRHLSQEHICDGSNCSVTIETKYKSHTVSGHEPICKYFKRILSKLSGLEDKCK